MIHPLLWCWLVQTQRTENMSTGKYTPGFVQALMAIQVLSVFSYRLYVRHQMVATIMRICQQDWLIILNLDMRIFMIGTMQFLILIPS